MPNRVDLVHIIIDKLISFFISANIIVFFSDISTTALVPQLDVSPPGDQELRVQSPLGRQHSFMEIDHEIFYTVILSLRILAVFTAKTLFWTLRS